MRAVGLEPRPSVLFTKFNTNYSGRSISFQTASRWLNGEGIPKHDKLIVLARMFRVEPQSLIYGDKPQFRVREPRGGWPSHLSGRDVLLFEEILVLPAKQRELIRNLVETLTESSTRRQKSD